MSPLKTILAATDLSAPARHAADRAARLAQETGASLVLLHALPVRALADLRRWLGPDMERQLHEDAGQRLQTMAADLQGTRQVKVDARLADADVLDEVDRQAKAVDADLVVVGARGAGFLRRLVLGTTAERLLRRTATPLLIVRALAHERYRRALLAVDFSPWSAEVIRLGRRVAPGARCVLFHAFQVPFEEKLRFAGVAGTEIDRYRAEARTQAAHRLQALAEQAGLQRGDWDACIVEGDASLRLVEQEQALDCDLVVLGKHGQSAAEDLLLGSVTKHVLSEGTADVLIATTTRPQ